MRFSGNVARRFAEAAIVAIVLVAAADSGAIAAPCAPDGTVHVDVSYAPPQGKTIAGVKIKLEYPPEVRIPGYADAEDVKNRVTGFPSGFLAAPDDLDAAVVVALVGTMALPSGRIFSVAFDHCKGDRPPAAVGFPCRVEQASTDGGVLVDGATCVAKVGGVEPADEAKHVKGDLR